MSISGYQCPHCNHTITKAELRSKGSLKQLLSRKPFDCPACEASVQLPEIYEKLTSIGLLLAVFIAPLLHLWGIKLLWSLIFLGLGSLMIIISLFTQKLVLISAPVQKEDSSDEI